MLHKLLQNFRSSPSFNIFFILCFSLGISGLFLVEAFKSGVEKKVATSAKNFIASDLSITVRRQFNDLEKKTILDYLKKQEVNISSWLETYSLISYNGKSKLADLNFVAENFPFYGGVTFEDDSLSTSEDWGVLHEKNDLWISQDLAWELGVKIGSKIKVGESSFIVSKIFIRDQFSSFRGFNLAPKVFLSKIKLSETKLMSFGSTGTDSILLKINAENLINTEKTIKKELTKLLKDPLIKVKGPKEASEQIGRSLNYLSDYLGLITLLTYILSLIGLYYFTQYFLSKNLKNIAIFKSLGFKPVHLFTMYLMHLLMLSIFSLIISTTLMSIIFPFMEHIISKNVGEQFILNLDTFVISKVGIVSVVGCLFGLFPIVFGAVKIPVNLVFQNLPQELNQISKYFYFPLVVYIVFLSILISHSIKIGLIFVFILFLMICLGYIFFSTSNFFIEKLSFSANIVLRHGVLAMTRYFNSSFTIFMSLTLGISLIVLILQIEKTLLNEFSVTSSAKRPDLFIFDLQDDQGDKFKEVLNTQNIQTTMFSPMIRARLIKINNEDISLARDSDEEKKFETREEQNQERFRTRGINLSYRSELSLSETIVKGKIFQGNCNGESIKCEISLEESYANRMNISLGNYLRFDVSGVEIEGVVTSFRKVKWTSFEPNFFILFQPGILEDAPKTYLASFRVSGPEQKRRVFNLVAEHFPNASLLEVSEVIRKINEVFTTMSFAIKLIAYLSLLVALTVVCAVSFNHLELKINEINLLKILGLNRNKIRWIYRFESAILVFSSVVVALIMGSMASYGILVYGFNFLIDFNFYMIMKILFGVLLILLFVVNIKIVQLTRLKNKTYPLNN